MTLESRSPSTNSAEVTFLSLLAWVLERRWILALWTVTGAATIAGSAYLVQGTRYTVAASVASSAGGTGADARLRGLASQLGFGDFANTSSTAVTSSPAVIMRLLESPILLGGVLDDSIPSPEDSLRWVLVIDALQSDDVGATPLEPGQRREQAIEALRSMIRKSRDRESEVVTFAVRSRSPQVSFWLARRLVEELNEFNLRIGQSQAADERRFVEERIGDQRTRLVAAEDRLSTFLKANRQYRESPDLVFAHDRLQREVELQQQVLVGLTQAIEDVRIREVRDTPVLVVIEPPELPGAPDSRELPRWIFLGALFGCFSGLGALAVTLQLRMRSDAGDRDVSHFLGALRDSIPFAGRSHRGA